MINKKPDRKPDRKEPRELPVASVVSDYGPRIIDLLQRVAALEARIANLEG
jgi:hypothetical protein